METSILPIVIGVTGHRDLVEAQLPALRQLVAEQLRALRQSHPNSEFFMLNSLAEGADMLCAEEALKQGIKLWVVLPMEQPEFETTLSPEGVQRFRSLLAQGQEVIVSPHLEPEQPGQDYCYRQAGLFIARHCQLMLALWDGKEEQKDGCGTAAAVYFSLHGGKQTEPSFVTGSRCDVLHIAVERQSSPHPIPLSVRRIAQDMDLNRQTLQTMDDFNRRAAALKTLSPALLPEEALNSPTLRRLNRVYQAADRLSMDDQRKYTHTLLMGAAFCVLLVLFYLLYDELETRGFLILYGLCLAAYGWLYRWAAKKLFLERHLQYRLLAEAARVQLFLSANGQNHNASQEFTWTQKQETAWIHSAIEGIMSLPVDHPSQSEEQIFRKWIIDQRAYHQKAAQKTAHANRIQQRISFSIGCAMVLSFLVTAVLEYGFPYFMTETLYFGLSPQSWMKILWGLLSAITLFFSDYLGKQSLSRKETDHRKMAALYSAAQDDFQRFPTQRSLLFRKLAREELIESGNWYSYSEENTLSFDL